jgi:hydroxymethylpyrimidine pyrophosphatase-like HAD family hydrolase
MTPYTGNSSPKISTHFSDVDGTLVADNKVLTVRAQAAVVKLHACCINFAVIRSRPLRGLGMLLRPSGITAPAYGFNGGVIATRDLIVITENLLSRFIFNSDRSNAQVASTYAAGRA